MEILIAGFLSLVVVLSLAWWVTDGFTLWGLEDDFKNNGED